MSRATTTPDPVPGSPTDPPGPAGGSRRSGGTDERRCGYRRCRAALPIYTGRGNRPTYCQDDKTWGSADLTCKQAENAYKAWESLQAGDGLITPQGLQDLGQRLDGFLEVAGDPLRQLVDLITRLLDAVTTTGHEIGEDVPAAYAARDAAQEAAAADRGARALAEQDAEAARADADQARAAAAAADAERAAAVRARDTAQASAQAAEHAQLRAEGRLTALQDRVDRAEQLTDEATARAAQLQVTLAERDTALAATEHTLAAERARAGALEETYRLDLREREAALDAERAEHRRQLDQRHTEHQQALAALAAEHDDQLAAERAARADALDAERGDREAALVRLTTAHAEQLGALRQRLGAAEHELTQLRNATPADGRPDPS